MAFQLIEHADAARFRDAVWEMLLASEAEYCVQLGLVARMVEGAWAAVSADEMERPLLLTVEEDGRVELVGIQTLKRQLLVTRGSERAAECLAAALVERRWDGQAIIGPTPTAAAIAQRYAALSGTRFERAVQLRTFELTAVCWPEVVAGSMRPCEPADREVLAAWRTAFAAEIGLPVGEEDELDAADRLIREGRIFFWQDADARPAAMAGSAGPTPHGIRVNSVYTPPERRGRGYASNLVAHLSQHLLDQGRRFCFLNTDLANPTSNSIYQKIGYRFSGDGERWELAAAS